MVCHFAFFLFLHNVLSHLIPNNIIFCFRISALYGCDSVSDCPENFCVHVPPLIVRCINFICMCDAPLLGIPEYDNNDDFVTVKREKPKIKNEEMMMRVRDMII